MTSRFRAALLLRVYVGFNIVVWTVLIKNMITDDSHDWGFRLVHIALAAISIGLAAAVWPLARRIDREPVESEDKR